MGSLIEINDTLKISKKRGFPAGLNLEAHIENYYNSSLKFLEKEFKFSNKGERLYHRPPTRVFLVEEMDNEKWLYWGHALITSQKIENGNTSGKYKIIKIYHPKYQKQATIQESPNGKNYFD